MMRAYIEDVIKGINAMPVSLTYCGWMGSQVSKVLDGSSIESHGPFVRKEYHYTAEGVRLVFEDAINGQKYEVLINAMRKGVQS